MSVLWKKNKGGYALMKKKQLQQWLVKISVVWEIVNFTEGGPKAPFSEKKFENSSYFLLLFLFCFCLCGQKFGQEGHFFQIFSISGEEISLFASSGSTSNVPHKKIIYVCTTHLILVVSNEGKIEIYFSSHFIVSNRMKHETLHTMRKI